MNAKNEPADRVFAEAMEIADPAARHTYLNRACANNPALRQEVESLLVAHEQAGKFMDAEAINGALNLPSASKSGDRIGRYKLLEQIGEGGFGVVWMAEQEEPVRRRVALKIIKLGMDTKEVVARFEAERQALAMMDHPNIARVFDGGATDTGRPYFVMELVKGIPITEYCDAAKLPTRKRLELFMQVCQAVQHAHQKGIIHRDLKPSNILVTVQDDKPVPKVIDFGVAKATQARLTQKTLFTRFQQWIGTPAYMSPEQAGLGSLDVDTRSDVYSLGVLLYELLTGRPPFDTQKLLAAGYDAVMRTIREQDAPKPSTRLSALTNDELCTVATNRGCEPAKLPRLVRGDLDWIVMKALEKDRARRYDTATSLAQDVERHLGAEPVSAAAPGLLYRTGKFVRRNQARLAFTTLALVASALAVAGGKFALNYYFARRDFQATGTNAVFTVAQTGDRASIRRLLDANPRLSEQRDAGGATPLAYAARAGNTDTLRQFLAGGAAVDATNRGGWTPLIEASARGHVSAVAVLLEAGADPNHLANNGESALVVASLPGSAELGRLLLAKGARVDAALLPSKTTALQQAAMLGHADFAELLLTQGARADLKDANGNTPLHAAASGLSAARVFGDWNRQLAYLSTRSPGSPNLASAAEAVSNRMAQFQSELPAKIYQAGGQHRRIAELLIQRGADLEATNGAGCTPLLNAVLFTNLPVAEVLVAHHADLNARGQRGLTPVAAAALRGDEAMASLLLDAGSDPNLADSAGFTPLNTAVEQEHLGVVKVLLAHQANPDVACPDGQTPLHTAAGHGDIETMRLLLDRGAALHPLTRLGTPLAWAVQSGKRAAVEFLLQRGAKPDVASPQTGMTALHWAATLGQSDIAQVLLDAGATVDADSSSQGPPLNAAAAGLHAAQAWIATAYAQTPQNFKPSNLPLGSHRDYVAVLRTLLAAKANVNAREPRFDRTPIFIAVTLGNFEAVELLVAAGADLQIVDRMGLTALHAASEMDAPALVMSNIVACLLKAGISPTARDQLRATPLHAAANAGRPIMVELLLKAGAPINAVGPSLCTPLQLAVMRGRRDVVEMLLASKADPEWLNAYGTTALIQSAQLQAKEFVELLLAHGADVNAGTTNGSTALMVAAQNGDLTVMKILLNRGAKINAANQLGWSAFLVAADAGQVDAARFLLEQGAAFDIEDTSGVTALIAAAKSGRLNMVKFLLERGAPIDARNKVGFTALHEAADRGHAEVVEFLLNRGMEVDPRSDYYRSTPLLSAANGVFTNEVYYVAVTKVLLAHGADVNARNSDSQTPLHRAAFWGHPRLVEVLLAAKAEVHARDASGKTALDLASALEQKLRLDVAAGRKECAVLLRKASMEAKSTEQR